MDNSTASFKANQKLIPPSDLFKKSFEFYKSRLYVITKLALICFVNFAIISFLMEAIGRSSDSIFIVGAGLLALVVFLASLVVNVWVQAAFFYLIKEKDTVSVKNLLAISWNNIFSYSWVMFLMGIVSLAGFLLLIIPGILFSIWFSLALYVFVFEDLKGMKALYKSKDLVKGYWWPVFGRLLFFGFFMGLIGMIPVFGNIANIFFIMPMGVIYGYFLYDDLKRVKI